MRKARQHTEVELASRSCTVRSGDLPKRARPCWLIGKREGQFPTACANFISV